MVPTGSLQGTLAGNAVSPPGTPALALPPPAPVALPPEYGGAQVPQDYAGLLQSPAFQPNQEEVPSGGHQALDAILASLGGFLGGQGLAAVPNAILGVRQNVQDIKQRNAEASKQSAKDRADFVMKGMAQSREDRLNIANQKVEDAKRLGDKVALQNAQQDLANSKSEFAAQQDRFEAEKTYAENRLKEQEAKHEGNPEVQNLFGDYAANLRRFSSQLRSQLSLGASEPAITTADGIVIRGAKAITEEFEAGLETALTNAAVLGADESDRDAIRQAYDSQIQVILDSWTAKEKAGKMAASREALGKAKIATQRQEKRLRGEARKQKAARDIRAGLGFQPLP